jgi:CheY-like chemotaxis protein
MRLVKMKSIMVVDDEPDNILTVKAVLEANKYNVITAVNGDDCLKKVNSRIKLHLILLDIMMPGTPVSKIVPQIKDIPIAYLTVVRMSEAEKEELLGQKNIVDFIQKPFDISDLLSRVKRLVG